MLTLSRPFGGLFQLSREFDDLFNAPTKHEWQGHFTPAVDIEENESGFVLHADLPGLSEKDIEVNVKDGQLLLSGKRNVSKEEKTGGRYLQERSYGSFCRQFNLGAKVDASKIEATYKNGVLTIVLPKKEESKPRQIPIATN